jgi:DNA-binding MarR family transcriptional regulator
MRKPFDGASHSREQAVSGVVDMLDALWDDGAKDVPAWAAHELTFGQMRLLFLLATHGPSPVGRVAEWLGVGLPAASGIVDRVERHGFVARRHGQGDRRIVECYLTDKGRELIGEIAGMRREVMRGVLDLLTDEELAEMNRLVTLIQQRKLERSGLRESRTDVPSKS